MNKKCNISGGGSKPQLLGGFGEINFGKQYRQGNRVYDSNAVDDIAKNRLSKQLNQNR